MNSAVICNLTLLTVGLYYKYACNSNLFAYLTCLTDLLHISYLGFPGVALMYGKLTICAEHVHVILSDTHFGYRNVKITYIKK